MENIIFHKPNCCNKCLKLNQGIKICVNPFCSCHCVQTKIIENRASLEDKSNRDMKNKDDFLIKLQEAWKIPWQAALKELEGSLPEMRGLEVGFTRDDFQRAVGFNSLLNNVKNIIKSLKDK